jgi:hypothetical protein
MRATERFGILMWLALLLAFHDCAQSIQPTLERTMTFIANTLNSRGIVSVFSTSLARKGLASISSKDLEVPHKDTSLAVRYNPTIRTLPHPKRTAIIRPIKLGVVSSQFGSPSMLNGVANKGMGVAATLSMPSMWQISNQVAFNTWLHYHPSPNSVCQDDSYTSFGANSTNEVGCDWRLQAGI